MTDLAYLPLQAAASGSLSAAINHLREFETAILTLSPRGADMPFHQHMTSWLYLACVTKPWQHLKMHIDWCL
eukprot:SAG31_NODE_6866_length_1866_cov_1.333899_2_plen_72_part_00